METDQLPPSLSSPLKVSEEKGGWNKGEKPTDLLQHNKEYLPYSPVGVAAGGGRCPAASRERWGVQGRKEHTVVLKGMLVLLCPWGCPWTPSAPSVLSERLPIHSPPTL